MRLPTKLQEKHMKGLFRKLNPEATEFGAFDEIDFSHALGGKEKFGENIEAMAEEYPQYQWTEGPKKDDPYEKYAIKDIGSQAKEYGYDIVKTTRLSQLEKMERELDITIKTLQQKEAQLNLLLAKPKTIKKTKAQAPKKRSAKPKTKKMQPKKPKVYTGKRGGKYQLKNIPGSRKKRRVYV